MGFFDLLNPFLASTDTWMAGVLPPLARLAVWAAIGALVSMGLYWAMSPQKMIGDLKIRIKQSQAALDAYEGEFKGALPLMRHSLALALRQVVVILIPAIVSSLPLLFLLAWLYATHGYRFPTPYTAATVHAMPARYTAHWKTGGARPKILIDDSAGRRVADVVIKVPLPTVTKRQWWNVFFGDPNGYLPARGPVERVGIGLPAKTYLGFGPGWLRGWETVFFAVLIVLSLIVKFVFRIR